VSRTKHHNQNTHIGEDFGGKYMCNKSYARPYGKSGRQLAHKEMRNDAKDIVRSELDAMLIEPEKEPWQLPEYGQHDQGDWAASEDGKRIESNDFTHDVWLKVSGDFVDDAQRKKYAENIAERLNATKPDLTDNR
jgi:hypothetical protein